MVFSTLTVAMRYEPANARFFSTEVRCDFINFPFGYSLMIAFVADTWSSLCMRSAQVRYASLTDAVRLLGCFARDDVIAECVNGEPTPKQDSVFNTFFCTFDDES